MHPATPALWRGSGRRGSSDICRVVTAPIVEVCPPPGPCWHSGTAPPTNRFAMADQRQLFQALSDFAHTLVLRYPIADVLFRLTDHVTAVLDVAGSGGSRGDDDGPLRFIAASTDTGPALERI